MNAQTQPPYQLAFADSKHPWSERHGLGKIARGVKGDLKSRFNPDWLWGKYDERFGERPDYRVWRRLAMWKHQSKHSLAWGEPHNIVATALASERETPVEMWGVLAVLPGCFADAAKDHKGIHETHGRPTLGDPQLYAALAKECLLKLDNLKVVGGMEAECALIGCILLDSIQHWTWETSHEAMSLNDAKRHLDRLDALLRSASANQNWQPGWTPPSFGAIRAARRITGDAIAPWDDFDVFYRLRQPLFRARDVVVKAVVREQRYDRDLLTRAYRFAVTAWRGTRALNRGQGEWLDSVRRLGVSEIFLRAELVVAELEENRALLRASQAARDLGDCLASARLAYLLLRRLPDWMRPERTAELQDKGLAAVVAGWEDVRTRDIHGLERRFADLVKELEEYPSKVTATVRQIGLDPDPRFPPRVRKEGKAPVCLSAPREEVSQETCDGSAGEAEDAPGTTGATTPLGLLVREEQKSDPRWAAILKRHGPCPGKPLDPVGQLYAEMRSAENKGKSISMPPDEVRDAFGVCLRYGHVATAARLLFLLPDPSLVELADFAHSVKRASQVIPIGVEARQYQKWQHILQGKWAAHALGLGAWQSLDQADLMNVLVLHEILVGRGLSLIREAGDAETRMLIEKHYGLLSESRLSDLLDTGVIAGTRGCATVTGQHLFDWLGGVSRRDKGGQLGAPVCVSVVPIGERELGVLLFGKDGYGGYRRWTCDKPLAEVLGGLRSFVRPFARGKGMLPWGRLRELASLISEQAMRIGTQWIVLAVPPELACLPWQVLFNAITPGVLVSLVPSLSWLVMAAERGNDWTPGLALRLSRTNGLKPLRDSIEVDAEKLSKGMGSVAVVMGHGVLVPEAPTVCFADKPLWIAEWLALAQYRICVVHSCFSGRAGSVFLGDIGGIPGLVLGDKCECLLAPVAEVSVETARQLHKALVNADGPEQLGLRYSHAVQEDSTVGLYNLYGLADAALSVAGQIAFSGSKAIA